MKHNKTVFILIAVLGVLAFCMSQALSQVKSDDWRQYDPKVDSPILKPRDVHHENLIKKLEDNKGKKLYLEELNDLIGGRFYFIADKDIIGRFPHLNKVKEEGEKVLGRGLKEDQQLLLYQTFVRESSFKFIPTPNPNDTHVVNLMGFSGIGYLWVVRNKNTKILEDVKINYIGDSVHDSYSDWIYDLYEMPRPHFKDILAEDKKA